MTAERSAPFGAFTSAACGYWLSVYPRVSRELRGWRARAEAIPDARLRALALEALAKRGNMEGAAACATFAPRARRDAVVRATVAFQTAYNHLDVLSEQPGADTPIRAQQLHQALLEALEPQAGMLTSSEHACDLREDSDDGGYLLVLINACRSSLRTLPLYSSVGAAARRAAERVVRFQSLNRGYAQGDHEALKRWAQAQTPADSGLHWWETAASAGSSLGVHLMIATAAARSIGPSQIDALENAYHPWIGALHSLLDQLIDIDEDARTAQRNLLDYYASPQEAAQRMAWLAERSLEHARALPPGVRHALIVAAMTSFYLSAPEAQHGDAAAATRAVLDAFGPLARPPLAIFRARRTAERVYYACREHGRNDRPAPSLTLAAGHR